MSDVLELSSSKSLVNRYLILKQGHPLLDFTWFSKARDVQNLKQALDLAPDSESYEIGEGGTTLRFFAAFLSTFKGEWFLECQESLLRRPQSELIAALKELGAELVQLSPNVLRLRSQGWQAEKIEITMKDSTQILTGLVLAALSRGLSLKVLLKEEGFNSDYFEMTRAFVKNLNFEISQVDGVVIVPGGQKILNQRSGKIEADWSSAAFLMILGALKGEIRIEGLEQKSLQPDSQIVNILEKMGASVEKPSGVSKGDLPYRSFSCDIQKSPDLFPVLCVLACFCEGESLIFGAPQLKNKETNRISQMQSLLSLCGYDVQARDDGISIKGAGLNLQTNQIFEFDVSKDHRLYMATEILNSMGYKIHAVGAESILKSFAEYENLKKGPLSCFF